MALQREPAADPDIRLTVLSSFNADLVPPFLVEALDRRGMSAAVTTADFGQIAQQALNPGSPLYADPETDALLIPAVEDMLAPLFEGQEQDADQLVDDRLAEIESSIQAILDTMPASTCYVVAFGSGRAPMPHVLAPVARERGQTFVARFLDGIRELSRLSPRVVVVDWDWHARDSGLAGLADDRLWYLGRMRLNPDGLAELADLTARHMAAYHGKARKVAVVDLDGTLWGGVVGEVGVGGLQLGDEGAGLAFRDFQRELLRLRDAGVVLALSSKNNREDAEEVFRSHPGMAMELSHFAAKRVNWTDKATSLREIAEELSLGLDSFVFLDDNPVERDWVSQSLPEVAVPELPADPAHRPAFLRGCGLFDRLELTDADQQRAAGYAAQGGRTRLRTQSMSFEDFLRSLDQEVDIAPVDDSLMPRAVQLCQRTNQFNLTTRRHSAADLEAMAASGKHELYAISVKDRFGDSGVTGLAILELRGEEAEVDTLLLSCRVLGRRVEDALLAFLVDRARVTGASSLIGSYRATERNGQVSTFYADRGFEEIEQGVFRLELAGAPVTMPDEMEVKVQARA